MRGSRWILAAAVIVAGVFLNVSGARAECGGTTQCIGVGLTLTDAQNAHHGGPADPTPSMAFGNQVIGTASSQQTLFVAAVTGPAGTQATLGPITITGTSASEFSVSGGTCSPSNGPIQGGTHCTVLVTFAPTSLGAKNATLHIPLNPPSCVGCITERSATLTGTGAAVLPGAGAASLSVQADTPTTIDLAPFVSGTGILGINISAAPANGTAVLNGFKITYTPKAGFTGSDSFSYTSFSATTVSAPAAVSISVVARPDPARDARVTGLIGAQAQVVGRFSRTQLFNFQQRMESTRTSTGPNANPSAGFRVFSPMGERGGQTLQVASLTSLESVMHAVASDFLPRLASAASSGSLNLSLSSDRGVGRGLSMPDDVNVWLGGNIRFGTRDQTSDSSALKFDSEGVSAGVDRRFSDRLLAGVGIGFGRGTTDIGGDGSKNSARGKSVTGYASYRLPNDMFLEGAMGYGTFDLESVRFVPAANGFARANRAGDQWYGSITTGADFRRDGLTFSPYGRVEYSHDRLDRATESGGGLGALTFFEQKLESLQAVAGFRAQTQHRARFGWVVPRVRIEMRHEFKGDSGATVGYADVPGGPVYSVSPAGFKRNSLALGLGSDFHLGGGLKLGVDYQLERQSNIERSHAIRFLITKQLDGKSTLPNSVEPRLGPSPWNVAAEYAWDDNVTRAQSGSDRLSDQVFGFNLNRRFVFPTSSTTRIVVMGFLAGDKLRNYEGLDRVGMGLAGEWQYRGSGAFSAPIWGVFLRGSLEDFRADMRSGVRESFGFNYRQSLTDRLSTNAMISRNWKSSRSSVFSTRDYSIRVAADYSLQAAGSLYASGEYRRGDSVSSGTPTAQNAVIARESAIDDAFGGRLMAYRFDAETYVWTLGFSKPLGPRDSLDFSWRHSTSSPMLRGTFPAPGGIYGAAGATVNVGETRYVSNLLSVAWLTRF